MSAAIAIIPARGGSKGVPRKNLQLVGGLPLLARTIRAALRAKSVERVYISTDDSAIADVARAHGAATIDRPPDISGDTASSEAALLHALDNLRDSGVEPEKVVFLQCTSPFTTAEDIEKVVGALDASGAEAAFSACEDHGFLWTVDPDGSARGLNHDSSRPRPRRQDLGAQYRETGAVYAMRTEAFRKHRSRFCGRVVAVPLLTPPLEIDTLDDLQMVQAMAPLLDACASRPPRAIRALVMDFDGVHTDDTVWVTQNGEESVRCSRADGMGLEKLRQAGFALLILSKERNPVVTARARKLQIEVLQQIEDKLPALEKWVQLRGLTLQQTAFVGNDINDVSCLQAAGWSASPADAHPAAKAAASHVCAKPGGRGALREVAEILLRGS